MEPPYFCDNFNRRQFFALSIVFIFVSLLALRLDDFIYWPYWVVFFPLWLWQSVVFGSFLFEIFAFCRSPRYYVGTQAHFKNAFFDAFFHVNLLFFEVLACNRLENAHHSWISVYIPLIILSIFGLFVSFWAIKNDVDGDLHLIVSFNILFFIFVALRSERLVSWSWKLVFLPNWVALGFFCTLEIIEIIMSISHLICLSSFSEYRQQSFCISVGYSISLLLIITSGILLALKLDNDLRLPCVIVASPLMSALTVFMSLCFSVRPHFQWRRCFQLLYRRIIKMCHPLQEYGNISYKLSSLHQSSSYDLPGRDGNQPSPPSGSDPQMITTSPPQPPPPPFMQPTPLVRVEIPKSSPKSAVLNADSLERQFLPHFLIPCRRKSKKRVLGTAGRVGGEGPGGDSDCSDTAISTRLDAPD